MIVECPQSKVKSVEITLEPRTCGGGPLVWTPVVKPLLERDDVDPFASYYEARTKRRSVGPHYLFANINDVDSMSTFFKQFGFPYFEGERLLLGEVLIEARRLRLLMEAWAAFRSDDAARTRERLGELAFALHHDAHWWYWPPLFSLVAGERIDDARTLERARSFLEWEVGHQRSIRDDKLYVDLMAATAHVCMEPLQQSELYPAWSTREEADGLCLALKPVRFLGEQEIHPDPRACPVVFEEPYLRGPYGFMFLLELSEGREVRACADEHCRGIFTATRPDRMFCTHECAHRTVVRNARRRAKLARRKQRAVRRRERT